MMMITMMMMTFFELGQLSEVLTTANLQHSASRFHSCIQPTFYLCKWNAQQTEVVMVIESSSWYVTKLFTFSTCLFCWQITVDLRITNSFYLQNHTSVLHSYIIENNLWRYKFCNLSFNLRLVTWSKVYVTLGVDIFHDKIPPCLVWCPYIFCMWRYYLFNLWQDFKRSRG